MPRAPKPEPGSYRTVAPGIYRRVSAQGDVYYLVRVYTPARGPGGRDNHYADSLQEARRIKAREEAKKSSRHRRRSGHSVASFAAWWLDDYSVNQAKRRDSTIRHYRDRVKPFLADFGRRSIKEVSLAEREIRLWVHGGEAIDSAVRKVAREWAGAAVVGGRVTVPAHPGVAQTLSVMFNDARRTIDVEVNPFAGLRGPKPRRKDRGIEPLTEEEVRTLAGLAGDLHGPYGELVIAPMILIAAWTGIRPGELFALYPSDVELERRDSADQPSPRLWARRAMESKSRQIGKTKTGRSRSIPIAPAAREAFASLGLDRLPQREPIFRNPNGRPLHLQALYYFWKPIRTAFAATRPPDHWLHDQTTSSGAKGNLDFYELRHFFGSMCAARGFTPYDIAEFMGHTDGGQLAMTTYITTRRDDAERRAHNAWAETAHPQPGAPTSTQRIHPHSQDPSLQPRRPAAGEGTP
jgi:integrase